MLPSIGDVFAFNRQQLDLSKPADLKRTIEETKPHLIVNAAAYTAVDQAESDEPTARAVNTDAPALMATEAKKIGAALVHYSTDYVFDGLKNSPYLENDLPNPVNVYGKTKLAGEQAVVEAGGPYLIFRTAWVYATHGRNFLLTILRLASQREELKIVRDQIGAPTWSREIARATTFILARVSKEPGSLNFDGLSGAYHMSASGITTWYDFAKVILDEAMRAPTHLPWLEAATNGQPIIARDILPIATSEYAAPARRPPYSVLSNERLSRTFGVQLLEWRTALHEAFRSYGLASGPTAEWPQQHDLSTPSRVNVTRSKESR
jgi:dTDP-4-dehydrorhamnose reductase